MSYRRTRVYVAGPISKEPYAGVYKGLCAFETLLDRGFAPFLPHLTAYVAMAIGERDYSVWMALDRTFLLTCDVLLRLPGESPGADQEIEWAKAAGMEVYYSLDSLVASESVSRLDQPLGGLLGAVIAELNSAMAEYPPFNSAHEGFSVLREEVDELWEVVRVKQKSPERPMLMRKEAVQVAAMALRFLKECC